MCFTLTLAGVWREKKPWFHVKDEQMCKAEMIEPCLSLYACNSRCFGHGTCCPVGCCSTCRSPPLLPGPSYCPWTPPHHTMSPWAWDLELSRKKQEEKRNTMQWVYLVILLIANSVLTWTFSLAVYSFLQDIPVHVCTYQTYAGCPSQTRTLCCPCWVHPSRRCCPWASPRQTSRCPPWQVEQR